MTLKHALLAMAASAAAIAWLGQFTSIDMQLAMAMFDPGSKSFPMRDAWWADTFSHVLLKRLLVLLGGTAWLAALWDYLRPYASLTQAERLGLRLIALSALAVPLGIAMLKRSSASHCPWDLATFGGNEAYVRLFDAALPGVQAGHCMPAGHASSALWLIALAAFWLPHQPRKAFMVFCAALGIGFALGWIQQLRGAHFLTHTLWSMWIACAIVGLLYAALHATGPARAATPPGRRTGAGSRSR